MPLDLNQFSYFLIVDLEATCDKNTLIPRHEMEIIEIGAIIIEAQNLTVIDEFQAFVKPILNPILTGFCTQLTSITDNDINTSKHYPEVIIEFNAWLSPYDEYLFCSWGDYDKKQFSQDCKLHNILYPICSDHLNIKKRFSDKQNLEHSLGLSEALNLLGIEFSGTHHRAIHDAHNMVKLMPIILGK